MGLSGRVSYQALLALYEKIEYERNWESALYVIRSVLVLIFPSARGNGPIGESLPVPNNS